MIVTLIARCGCSERRVETIPVDVDSPRMLCPMWPGRRVRRSRRSPGLSSRGATTRSRSIRPTYFRWSSFAGTRRSLSRWRPVAATSITSATSCAIPPSAVTATVRSSRYPTTAASTTVLAPSPPTPTRACSRPGMEGRARQLLGLVDPRPGPWHLCPGIHRLRPRGPACTTVPETPTRRVAQPATSSSQVAATTLCHGPISTSTVVMVTRPAKPSMASISGSVSL